MGCRINRRRMWTHRILLETCKHEASTFATLTYSDDCEPVGGTLVPRDLQLFFKRLRKADGRNAIRYFACGEYGDRTSRPHYHAAIFGFPTCENSGLVRGECACRPCCVVRETWGFGHVMLGEISISSAAYIAGYVVKKWTSKDVPALNGRHPEFARMSLRPGIGADAMLDVALAMRRSPLDERVIPAGLRHGSKILPLGRYLRKRLRGELGQEATLGTRADPLPVDGALQLVRAFAFANSRSVSEVLGELAGVPGNYESRGKL